VNKAAIGTPRLPLGQALLTAFQTNAVSLALMVEAFAPLPKKSNGTPRVINVSTGGGSVPMRLDAKAQGYQMVSVTYRVSKSALHMITACQVFEYGPAGFKVFVYNPGFTVSNLGPLNNAQHGAQPTSAGAAPIVMIVNGERDAEHGGFLHEHGQHP
jgi:NAD(P)-dependent dehydrogenase (short-subunit alcohol dehydrogenase family)